MHLFAGIIALVLGFAFFGKLLFVIATIFWIWMLIDILRRRFPSDILKIILFVAVFCTHACGAIVYFLVGRSLGSID